MSSLPASRFSPFAGRAPRTTFQGARPARFEAFGLSHRGLVRPSNEDSYLVAPELGLCAVADGMGGEAAGDVASKLTVDAIRWAFENTEVTWPGAMNGLPPPAPGLPRLVAAIERANVRVYAEARADEAKRGMGTTVTSVLVLDDRAAVAHVGDSRLYRFRRGRLELLTHDHSLVEERVRAGIMTREEAKHSTQRNVITRAIGTDADVKVDPRLVPIAPGDTFLLATDGLHGVVGDDDIAAILRAEPDVTRAGAHLVDAAMDAGAPDNITVVLLRII